ncbi:MAG: hypothetical protein AAF571_07830 [Verrucomicrobiota bacterium]
MNPLFAIEYVILSGLVLAALGALASWSSSSICSPGRRALLAALRALALASLILPALNPGQWVAPEEPADRETVILLDQSASMATQDVNGETRINAARRMALETTADAEGAEVMLRIFTFDDQVREITAAEVNELEAGNQSTDIVGSVASLLDQYPPGGTRLEGIVLLSDGRQIDSTPEEALLTRAQARGVPVHTKTFGESNRVDVSISTIHRHHTTFVEQRLRVRAVLRNLGAGSLRQPVVLKAEDGTQLQEQEIPIVAGGQSELSFEIDTSAPGYFEYTLETPSAAEEVDTSNNRTTIGVTVLEEKIRVLLVEGSPYWDTKFIAQLLQSHPNYELELVTRLTDRRFFSAGKAAEDEAAGELLDADPTLFPEDLESIRQYDLIVLGQSVENFLDEEKVSLLRRWISEDGGSLICARGNPVTTPMPSLAGFMPMIWEDSWDAAYRWVPTYAGENVRLFGASLPGRENPIWNKLPLLGQASLGRPARSFAQTLVEGVADIQGQERRFPVVVSQRLGEGLVAAVNSGDLWQWDFLPDAAGSRDVYRDFWMQLFNWSVTFSEFLPGHQFALQVSRSRVGMDEPVRLRLRMRPAISGEFLPLLKIAAPDGSVRQLNPAASTRSPNLWEAMVMFEQEGSHHVMLDLEEGVSGISVAGKLQPPPAEIVEVIAPPREDQLVAADFEFMQRLAEMTGGSVLENEDGSVSLLGTEPGEEGKIEAQAKWESRWDRAILFFPILALFSLEWIIRRRSGLL